MMKHQKSNFSKFMLLWAGELVSAVGGGLTSFGLSVYVFRQTGSAASMGLVTLLAFLPTLLLSVPAGVLADRYDRRLLMMIGDGCSALGIVYILVCMLHGEAALYQICIGVFISSVFSSLLEPSYRATVTDLLTEEEYSKASGLVSIAGSARYLVSPVLAGVLLAVSDIRLLFVIDISTFVLTVISTAVVRKGIAVKKSENRTAFGESLRQGWRAITDRARMLMQKLSISGLEKRSITQVSGGQLQRACICRSMMNQPEILFADEPTGALNKSAAAEVMEEFVRLNKEGTTILLVTHDSKVASRCHRVLYLLDGSVRGELKLPKMTDDTEKRREEKVNQWLMQMGW